MKSAPLLLAVLLVLAGCSARTAQRDAVGYGGYHEANLSAPSGTERADALPAVQNGQDASYIQQNASDAPGNGQNASVEGISGKVVPPGGIGLGARWNDLGPRLIAAGAVNITKFSALMERNGRPLTPGQLEILERGSGEIISIDRNNSYFVLNLFWGFGLANDNKILRNFSGGIGSPAVGNLASTGFWSLGERSGRELFASSKIIELSESQQALVEEVAGNTYRPCCDNPTAFPDCNHGMAALGLAEWMAYQNASEEEIYDALLAANGYWFPQAYVETAAYFEYQNISWGTLDAKEILSTDYSSYSGYQNTRKTLEGFPPVAIPGGGCGA